MFVIDLETTGFRGFPQDFVLEVGIAKITDFQEVEVVYHSLISHDELYRSKIEKCWWFRNTKVELQDLQDAPNMVQVWEDVRKIINGKVLTSWNVGFDLTRYVDRIPPPCAYMREKDPMRVAATMMRDLYGRYKTPTLSATAEYLGLDYDFHANHRADYDALVTGKVILEMYDLGKYIPSWTHATP